ncbi:MAG TPA: hypothetical protein VFK80_00145 [Limnochordia bacterium]|nr:hypothetical protein [Limnochordia bacterium]
MDVIAYELNRSIPLPSFADAGSVIALLNQGMTPAFALQSSVVSAAGTTAKAAQAKLDEVLGRK